jgi:hypothetical protein
VPISIDLVPSTVCQAAELIASSVSSDNRERIRNSEPTEQHFGLGLGIRDGWSHWEAHTPLKRDAATNYGIVHADDISGLITAWARALVAGEEFDPLAHCNRYHEHWAEG